jgi:hypothetical protein
MIRKILLAAVFAGAIPFVQAQQTMEEVVYLKNGSIIRGIIIEQVPNRTIKIQTADGNLFVYDVDEIEKLTKEPAPGKRNATERNSPPPDAPAAPDEKRTGRFSGMIQYVGLTVQPVETSSQVAYLEASFICGYRYRDRLFVGGGIGLEHMFGDFHGGYKLRIPVFATLRLNMNHRRISPYIQFDTGARSNGDSYFEDGFFFFPKAGIDFVLGARRQRSLSLSLSLFEYGKHPVAYVYDSDYYSGYDTDYFEQGFYTKIGLQFGYRF